MGLEVTQLLNHESGRDRGLGVGKREKEKERDGERGRVCERDLHF